MDFSLAQYSQWMCGHDNVIPVICSRDLHLLENELIDNLTRFFSSSPPAKDIPKLKMREVHKEIDSFFAQCCSSCPRIRYGLINTRQAGSSLEKMDTVPSIRQH